MAPDDYNKSVEPVMSSKKFSQQGPRSHGQHLRSLTAETLNVRSSNGDPGKFGRMFPNLPGLVVEDDALFELAEAMVDTAMDPTGDNPGIPAGYTYFGQFADHDITLDTTPLHVQAADPLATENFRTPALDLDSLYAEGPRRSPQLYARLPRPPYPTSNKFLIGATSASPAENVPTALPNDLPRNAVGRALIGDERNDENLAVAQTHLAFLKFHNAVVDFLSAEQPNLKGAAQFEEAKRIVTWHYQWIVLFDWVERLTEPGLVHKIKEQGRQFYRFETTPYIPAEFSAAAYRLGHSMIREIYDYNRVFGTDIGALTPASLQLLFGFTGKSGAIVGALVDDPGVLPTPGIPGGKLRDLPGNWIIDWRRFFDLDSAVRPNPSRKLDALMAPALKNLPGETDRNAVLAFRNLSRGTQVGLPSGQSVAQHMGLEPMSPEVIATGVGGEAARKHGLHEETPLWFYILKESEQLNQGLRLGPVGSTIIVETFLGLVHGDQRSFLWQRKNWEPELPGAEPGHFTMADLLRFVNDINPIGES
ncbi:peroxidase family protein [Sulfitobacter sp. MF3-043]|uniref:peroxidase family protein n=1 Tax=Sulfitobacter sediminivivens TaxID=3252902 RepID=UPI0036DB1CD9